MKIYLISFLIYFIALIPFSYSQEDHSSPLLSSSSNQSLDLEEEDTIRDVDESAKIPIIDSETGVSLGSYNTLKDDSRYSLLLHFNSDIRDAGALTAFEFSYAKNLEWAWLEFTVVKTTILFSEITTVNGSVFNGIATDEIESENADLLTLGVGLSYRTSLIQNIIRSSRLFETIAANLVYNQFSETLTATKFTGFGIKADFGMHYRTSESFHIGTKFSYNLSTVTSPADGATTPTADRSLTLSFISLALDISYYF